MISFRVACGGDRNSAANGRPGSDNGRRRSRIVAAALRVTAAGAEKGTDCENTPATGIKADVTAEIAAGEKNKKE